MIVCFFFFKQKTAYEMRISDWSSDVCSSDLIGRLRIDNRLGTTVVSAPSFTRNGCGMRSNHSSRSTRNPRRARWAPRQICTPPASVKWRLFLRAGRSEEHTSELQSLMRILYAVFCLKQKKD